MAESTSGRRDQVKLAIRIWTAVGKFIRSQCNKGRVIDTLNFGTFAKASTIGVTGPDMENYYVYCSGPNSAFSTSENLQNVNDIPQGVSSAAQLSLIITSDVRRSLKINSSSSTLTLLQLSPAVRPTLSRTFLPPSRWTWSTWYMCGASILTSTSWSVLLTSPRRALLSSNRWLLPTLSATSHPCCQQT